MLDRRTLPLSALRAFEAAVKYQNLRLAGEKLGVTHGAISHQIRKLEDYLGQPLFSRSHNRLQLTAAGDQLYQSVREGFDRIFDGVRNLDLESVTGPLVIGCSITTAASWAIKYIYEFQELYPQIDLHVAEIFPNQPALPKRIDVALCYGRPTADDWVISELAEPSLYAFCSPRYLHQINSITHPADVSGVTLLHDQQNSWRDWFNNMETPYPENNRHLHFENTYLCLNAARRGYGIALCNLLETQEDVREGSLMPIINKPVPEAQKYYIAGTPKEQRAARVQLFIDWIRDVVAAQNADPAMQI